MKPDLWPRRSPPAVAGPSWERQVSSLAQLRHLRAELAAHLQSIGDGHARGDDADSTDDQLILVVDELASNGLRHGIAPVTARVVAMARGWLVIISDRGTDVGPEPAVGRDPARGGMGLHLVAELTSERGWSVADGHKHVWACCR